MILDAAPVFAEEEVKVEETKEINYKEAYLQNVVAAKEAAVKEAEAKLEAAKKAVEKDVNVALSKASLETAEKTLSDKEKDLKKSMDDADKAVKEIIKKMLGEGELDLTDSAQNVAYKAVAEAESTLATSVAAQKAAEAVENTIASFLNDSKNGLANWKAAAKKAYEDKKTAEDMPETNETEKAAKKVAKEKAKAAVETYTAVGKTTFADGDYTLETLGTKYGSVVAANAAAKGTVKTNEGLLKAAKEALHKAQNAIGSANATFDDIKVEGMTKMELAYALQHNYPAYYKAVYDVDVAKGEVVKAKALYETALANSKFNKGVVEATAALEAAKAELEAAKAELNAAKAGVEEKPEVVVDKRQL